MIRDAYRFLIPLLAITLIFALVGLHVPAFITLLLSLFVAFFFRNPIRKIPPGEQLVVSPADGKVVKISALPGRDGTEEGHNISIFLNIFDVHVNRSPITGQVQQLEYKRGRFKAAFDEQASHVNEQNVLTIEGQGTRVIVKQIAGLIARRVVCWKQPGHHVQRGELIGLIRFGSRVDVTLPKHVKVLVAVGEHVKGGSSVIGECT